MENMYSIGEISKIVRISTDTLRYYDEISLLKPCFIDPDTKYRYYSKEQLAYITKILELKQNGFSLSSIKSILNNCKPMNEIYNAKLEELIEEELCISKKIARLRAKLKEEANMDRTVLVVDDVAFMNNMIKDILVRNGYSISGQAFNGIEAVNIFRETKPSIVILDITMPNMDGFDVMIEIKDIDNDVKIIMCTGYWQPNMVLKSLKLGASNYIMKPFMPEGLLQAIDNALERHKDFSQAIINELLEDDRIKAIDKRNVITGQEFIDDIIEACASGSTEFLGDY